MFEQTFRRAAFLCAGLGLVGCSSWRMSTPLHSIPSSYDASVVRVTLRDSRMLTIYQPRIFGDSVVGWREPPRRSSDVGTVSAALADVQEIERREFDPLKSAGLVAGMYLGAKALYAAMFLAFLFSGE